MKAMRFGKHRIDLEMIISFLGMAFMEAIGFFSLFGAFSGIQVFKIERLAFNGILFGLTGLFFGILMLLKR